MNPERLGMVLNPLMKLLTARFTPSEPVDSAVYPLDECQKQVDLSRFLV